MIPEESFNLHTITPPSFYLLVLSMGMPLSQLMLYFLSDGFNVSYAVS